MRGEFRKTIGGAIVSSQGFKVRILGRIGLSYEDSEGRIDLDSESDAGRKIGVTIFTKNIPDAVDRPKGQVLDNVSRAFAFAGWSLHLDTSGDDSFGQN